MSLYEEFKNGLLSRFNDSVIGTYITAFLVCNWKIFFYALDDKKTALEKIDNIKSNVMDCGGYGIWMPIIVTIVYIFAYPFLRTQVRRFLVWQGKQEQRQLDKEKILEEIEKLNADKITLQNKIDELAKLSDDKQKQISDVSRRNNEMNKISKNILTELNYLVGLLSRVYNKDETFKQGFEAKFPKLVDSFVSFFSVSAPHDNSYLKDLAEVVRKANKVGLPLNMIHANTLKNIGLYKEEE